MFDKRHRITLLFNANKAYDRQVVEGVGEYLQASQSEWDIFIEEDFRARIDNIKEWLGDGVIADYDDDEIARLLVDVHVPIIGVGGSYHLAENYPPVHYIATDNHALVESAFLHLKEKRGQPVCLLRPACLQRKALGGGTRACLPPVGGGGEVSWRGVPGTGNRA